MFQIKAVPDKSETVEEPKFERALNAVPDKLSQETPVNKCITAGAKAQEEVRSTPEAVVEDEKWGTNDCRHGNTDAEVRSAPCGVFKE